MAFWPPRGTILGLRNARRNTSAVSAAATNSRMTTRLMQSVVPPTCQMHGHWYSSFTDGIESLKPPRVARIAGTRPCSIASNLDPHRLGPGRLVDHGRRGALGGQEPARHHEPRLVDRHRERRGDRGEAERG